MNTEGLHSFVLWLMSLALSLFACSVSLGQVENAPRESEKPSSCEHVTMFLDDAIERVQKLGDPNARLILIFALGKGETEVSLNTDRMNLINKSITRRNPILRFILATNSDRADDLGRADIYIEGRLFYALYFAMNSKQCSTTE